MLGIVWFLAFQGAAVALLCRRGRVGGAAERLWLGSVCGSVLSIWLPIPFAFLLGFTVGAHLCAAAAGALLIALGFRLLPAAEPFGSRQETKELRPFLFLFLPLMALCVYLLLSHTLAQRDGALYTGQCTFGDMAMHLGFISSIAVQGVFPPEYSILPGVRLCYPFLCDSVSSSLCLLGTPLRWAYMLPCFFALAQVFGGFYLLARRICPRRGAALLSMVLLFFNGGLGMLYFLNKNGLRTLLTGFYKTPTNYTTVNLRWVNVIVDMLIPQRATLFGWSILFAVLYLLYRAVFEREERFWLPAGVLGGLLPMIHTHSYFALGLVAACWLVYSLARDGLCRDWLRGWLRFGLCAVLIAAPQLLLWTFRSVGGNEQFLRVHFDWVNGGEENWLWFWLKNVGPLFFLAPLSLLLADRERRGVFFPALLIFALCELVVFQPNVYDNNKLLYVSYALFCILTADTLLRWAERIKARALRAAALALLIGVCTNAALFTMAREIVSGTARWSYELFSPHAAAAAEFVRENTDPNALFLTAGNHNNPVAALTGRKVYCGCPSYLFYHGLDYADRAEKEERMLRGGEDFESLRGKIGIDYVYIGPYERAVSRLGAEYFDEHYPAVFRSGDVTIYKIG